MLAVVAAADAKPARGSEFEGPCAAEADGGERDSTEEDSGDADSSGDSRGSASSGERESIAAVVGAVVRG